MADGSALGGRFRTRIVRAQPKGRLIALSDIHGRADLLEALLKRMDLHDEDMLVIVGDLIERGGESLKVVRMAMELAQRPETLVLMGNKDGYIVGLIENDTDENAQRLWYYFRSHGASLFTDMCREIGVEPKGPEDIKAAKEKVRRAFEAELGFLAERPTILDTPVWTFVHGGLPAPDIDALEGTDAFACMKLDAFAEKEIVCRKNTVVGHYPVGLYRDGPLRLDPYWRADKRILSIDGGCGLREEGQLNAVFCRTDGTFVHIALDGLPTLAAQDGQRAAAPTVRFRWPNGGARLVEDRHGGALVEQTATGRRCFVPERFLRRQPGSDQLAVNDFSDARLEIAPGDTLSVIAQADGGLYVKKDGISGWYFGETKRNEA